nr:hypothetical protein [Brevibacillus brevis]
MNVAIPTIQEQAASCEYNTNTIHCGILRTVLCRIIDCRSSLRGLARKKKDVPCRHGDIYCGFGVVWDFNEWGLPHFFTRNPGYWGSDIDTSGVVDYSGDFSA